MTLSMGTSWCLLLLASVLSPLCGPLNPPSSSAATLKGDCYDYEIPVITHINAVTWNHAEFSDNTMWQDFFENLARRNASTVFKLISGPQNTTSTGNYSISATFCSTKTSNGHEKTVLVPTTGLGFDRR